MIISFAHNFAFIAVPRTGTHGVREHLRASLGGNDWEQCARYDRRAFPVPALAEIGHGHLTAAQVQPHLIKGLWDRLFTFAFVRDPLDRFESCCYFLNRKNQAMQDDPIGTMHRILDKVEAGAQGGGQLLLKPQYGLICDDDGAIMLDHVARYENYAAEFDAIAARIGLDARMERVVNASPRPPRAPVDAEIAARVAVIYRRDYDIFDYDQFS